MKLWKKMQDALVYNGGYEPEQPICVGDHKALMEVIEQLKRMDVEAE